MLIREAKVQDIPQLLQWGAKFYEASPWNGIGYDMHAVAQTLQGMIEAEHAVLLMHNKGAIGGFMVPTFFNPEHIIAQELFWWAEDEGLPLLEAFEGWAEDMGANAILMMSIQDQGRLEKIYSKSGYSKADEHFVKVL